MAYSREECLSSLKKAADQLGHSPSTNEYESLRINPKSADTIAKACGSWNEAKRKAGLSVGAIQNPTESDCIRGLERARDILGHEPAYHEYVALDVLPCAMTIEDVCGSWNEAKERAGFETVEQHATLRTVDERYFESVDTAETAYWLGFLFGDGSIVDGGYRHMLHLELQRRDGHHVRRFARAVESDYKIADLDRHVETTSIRITNQRFIDHLIGAGLTPDKNSVPPVDPHFRPAFIRGLFDADGSFPESYVNISSTKQHHLKTIAEWYTDLGIEGTHYEYERKPGAAGSDYFQLNVFGRPGIAAAWGVLWPDGTDTDPCLARKANRIDAYLD
jgi:hypothetical protein